MSYKRVLVFTGTRADYGIMYWLLKDLQTHNAVELQLLVSGTHLCREYGSTYKEIENDGFDITSKVDILSDENTPLGIAKTVATAISGYAEALNRHKPDVVIILGDRYEAMAMAQAAFLQKIPIAHLHGGEITEGANDDRMRHAISKLSDLHFASSPIHRRRLVQLGENPDTVFVSGAPGLEHISRSDLPSVARISELFEFDFSQPYLLIAYHPVTNSNDSGIVELIAMLDACSTFSAFNFVLSISNADHGSDMVGAQILEFCKSHTKKSLLKKTYGHLNFLSIIKYAAVMIGNSSSGVIEAPSLETPSIDIGSRQKGRERAGSVISVSGTTHSIKNTIRSVVESEHSDFDYSNPYHKENSSSVIMEKLLSARFCAAKQFHDTSAISNQRVVTNVQ